MPDVPLYRIVLGDAYDRLPPAVRRMHDADVMFAEGTAVVTRGSSLLAGLACAVIGFPVAGAHVAVRVDFERDGAHEVWRRTFAGRRFRSVQGAGQGRHGGHVIERFGPLSSALRVTATADGLTVVPTSAWLLGLPIPRAFAPTGRGIEREIDGSFAFDIEIALAGRMIVTYVGTLRPGP